MSDVNFTEALGSLEGISLDQLEAIMKETRNAIKSKEQEELIKREENFAEELKPFEDQIKNADEFLTIELKTIDDQIELLKESKKTKQLEHQNELEGILQRYNEKRKDLGLPIKTLRNVKGGGKGVSRNRTGASHRYDIFFIDDNEEIVKVIINKNEDTSFTLNIKEGIHVKDVEEAMKGFGIDIRGGGMCRGVVNRIRKLKLQSRNDKQENANA